ncbi:MAG TPA: (p)ppGpp synthetase [Firmicutes bacterium]|nr:(p)ppGpp synthetase [Bacillota bacterium]
MSMQLLKKSFTRYNRKKEDWLLIKRAYQFALSAHADQKRVSGDSYITHPLGVACILTELELDLVTIITGLLHDVLEDTPVTYADLEREFGGEVAGLVDGATKLSRMEFRSKEEQQAETWRKMFVAMARDIRVILVKLADRTHNMRTLHYLSDTKQHEIARETLDIYAPLAHRLGIYKVKWELEDLAFRYLNKKDYYYLVEKLAKKRREREEYINNALAELAAGIKEAGIAADVQGRPKHIFSIYTKMKEQGKEFNEIYDLTALRVIVNTVRDCYAALGVVHTLWRPIPGHFNDYIAMPKPNMYQSLHTTVVYGTERLEVQIRTREMHRTSEYGIAAHWRYKEKAKDDQEFAEKLSWLRQLLEWQQELKDAQEFMEHLRVDLFSDEVFVFTPRGDVIALPAGAGPLDFAYRIHTDVGNRCVGAKINGRIVPLDYILKMGDMAEIITSKQGTPSRDWLKMVTSSVAKSKIRAWFKKERREENIDKGRDSLERELRRLQLEPHQLLKEPLLEEVGRRYNLLSVDDLFAAVGYGGVSTHQIISRLREEYTRKYGAEEKGKLTLPPLKPWKEPTRATGGVKIQGIDNMLVRFSRCCNPLPGDEIAGFVTRGRGVSIHRRDCPNIRQALQNKERLMDVYWEAQSDVSYLVALEVTAMDRPNLLSDVVQAISDCKVNISSVNARVARDGTATINLTFVVTDLEHLEFVMNKIRRVRDVFTVGRPMGNGSPPAKRYPRASGKGR